MDIMQGFNRTILVVEDQLNLRELLMLILVQEGYIVMEAGNGEEAADYLLNNPPPQLILLDLHMPYMNGWEFLDWTKQHQALTQIPIVAMSGHNDCRASVLCRGAQEFFAKPLDVDQLLKAVCMLTSKPLVKAS